MKRRATDELTEKFIREHRGRCACIPLSAGQKAYYPLVALPFLFLLLYRWDYFLFVLSVVLILIYLLAALLRTGAAWISYFRHPEISVAADETGALAEQELPVYTILVPLYHEAEVAGKILAHLAALDYPKDKLDVKLLLECDDGETRESLARCGLPPWCSVVDVPDGTPRTKPRACNYGLAEARGDFLVIYDAEDEPERDQLRKAVCAFRRDGTGRLVCVQAKLNFYNAEQNFLTRLFTVEYSTHFDMQLPGLQKFRLPLPLGGTSNHFRTEALRKLGGWDPFNVTEDCDLGIRIFEAGFHTDVLESTTWEEANPKIGNWMRQRSRWVKGFLQTHLVHYRNPAETMRRLGIRGFFGCYSFVGASVLMLLANVIYWPLILLYAVLLFHALHAGEPLFSIIRGPRTAETLYHGISFLQWHVSAWPLYYAGPGEDVLLSVLSQVFFGLGLFLFLTNIALVAAHALGCVKRGFFRLLPFSLLMPLYWILISIAAWKGVLQFIRKPFYWEKTRHGLASVPQQTGKGGTNAQTSL